MRIKINRRKANLGQFLNLLGVITGMVSSLLLAITFYAAYFNEYHICIEINNYNEAHIEAFIVLPFYVIVTMYSMVYNSRGTKDE